MFLKPLRSVSVVRVVKPLGRELIDGPLLDVAAQLSYFFLFSLFPLLFFVVALLPYLHLGNVVDEALGQLGPFVPRAAMEIVQGHLHDLTTNTRPRLLSIGLLLALWSASRGVNAFRVALNVAYQVRESRSFLRIQVLCILLLIATTLLTAICFGLMLAGGRAGQWAAEQLNIGGAFVLVWSWLRWPISALIVFAATSLLYYLLPDVKQRLVFLLPGALVATVLWLFMTWGFTQYVEHFGNYNVTYGSIGGIIVLMTWLYLTGLIFLLGGKLNALVEHASAEGKSPGEREEDPATASAAS